MTKLNMFKLAISLAVSVALTPLAEAQNVNLGSGSRSSSTGGTGSTGGGTSTRSGTGSGGSTNGSSGMPTPSGGGSYNGAAGQSRGDANMNAAMNGAMGAYFISGCSWASWWNCVLGGLSFVQAYRGLQQARDSGRIADLTGKPGEYCPGCDTGGDDPANWDGSGLPQDQVIAYKKLNELGYKIGKDGSITAPDGRKFNANDFANEQSMQAAGVPAGTASGLAKSMAAASAAIEKKYADGAGASVVSMGVDGGGGGGRSPASYDAGSDTSFDDYLKRLRSPFGMNGNQKQQMLAGKSLNHGDDQIGVKEDDIFRMVHRRYQERRAGDDFIELTSATAAAGSGAVGASASPLKSAPKLSTRKGP